MISERRAPWPHGVSYPPRASCGVLRKPRTSIPASLDRPKTQKTHFLTNLISKIKPIKRGQAQASPGIFRVLPTQMDLEDRLHPQNSGGDPGAGLRKLTP